MTATTSPRYLVEWFHADLTDEWVDTFVAALEAAVAHTQVQLIVTMAVHTDEVLYAVLAAPSAEAISQVCLSAGLPPQRITADVDARIHLVTVG